MKNIIAIRTHVCVRANIVNTINTSTSQFEFAFIFVVLLVTLSMFVFWCFCCTYLFMPFILQFYYYFWLCTYIFLRFTNFRQYFCSVRCASIFIWILFTFTTIFQLNVYCKIHFHTIKDSIVFILHVHI